MAQYGYRLLMATDGYCINYKWLYLEEKQMPRSAKMHLDPSRCTSAGYATSNIPRHPKTIRFESHIGSLGAVTSVGIQDTGTRLDMSG
jgi:hypothetical protein